MPGSGAQPVVDFDRLRIFVESDAPDRELGQVGGPTRGNHQLLRANLAVGRPEHGVIVVALDAFDRRTGANDDPVRAEDLGDQCARFRLFLVEHAVSRFDHGDGGTESTPRLRELDAHTAGAEHGNRFGKGVGRDRVAVRPERHVLDPGNVGHRG